MGCSIAELLDLLAGWSDDDLLVSDLLTEDGNWLLPDAFRDKFPMLSTIIEKVPIVDGLDSLV